MKKIVFSLSLFILFGIGSSSAQVLTYKDVAGIFYARCTSCHHEGANHYSFMNYTKTNQYKVGIQNALVNKKMPPWKADTAYTRFMHERLISVNEKNTILNWIATGATKGDTTQAPPQPVYPSKYQLKGNADLSVTIPTFTSFATTNDIYVCFSMPSNLTQDRIIRAYEIVPGNKQIVHHAVLTVDTTGNYMGNMSGNCVNIPGNLEIGAYAPGTQAKIFPSKPPLKTGIRVKAGSKIILQMHYPKGSNGQVDSTRVRFYFYPTTETGIRLLNVATPLQNWSMFIPANTTQTFTAYFPPSGTLPAPISIFGVFPHSHVIAKSMLLYAVKPGIDTIPMIRINDWDFEWQDYYLYKKLLHVPAGYRLFAKHVYDNTTSNLNNPNNPPINVQAGFGTNDEMLFDGIMSLPYQPGDELIDLEAIINSDTLLATGVRPKLISSSGTTAMAYPNPFSGSVKVKFFMEESAPLQFTITDLMGRVVLRAKPSQIKEGEINEYTWDGKNEEGNTVAPGVYFLEISSASSKTVLKLQRY